MTAFLFLFSVAPAFAQAPTSSLAVPEHLNESFQFISGCARDQAWAKVEASTPTKKFLGGLGRSLGQILPVYSCFRSQESQDVILKRNKCKPLYGDVECSGRIAANVSEHTIGVAADFMVNVAIPKNSGNPAKDGEIVKLCQMLDRIRTAQAGGRGGITIYGINEDSVAMAHYDNKQDWCNWAGCEKIGTKQVLGEGHCKRKKFQDKEARLELELATAKRMKLEAEIAKIDAELVRLRADCPPGDLSCRDSFQN